MWVQLSPGGGTHQQYWAWPLAEFILLAMPMASVLNRAAAAELQADPSAHISLVQLEPSVQATSSAVRSPSSKPGPSASRKESGSPTAAAAPIPVVDVPFPLDAAARADCIVRDCRQSTSQQWNRGRLARGAGPDGGAYHQTNKTICCLNLQCHRGLHSLKNLVHLHAAPPHSQHTEGLATAGPASLLLWFTVLPGPSVALQFHWTKESFAMQSNTSAGAMFGGTHAVWYCHPWFGRWFVGPCATAPRTRVVANNATA
jgi:hypothetical protein